MKRALWLAGFVVSVLAAVSRVTTQAPAAAWWAHVAFLADDRLKGRETGSPEHREAAEYIARQFKDAGLQPAGTDTVSSLFVFLYLLESKAKGVAELFLTHAQHHPPHAHTRTHVVTTLRRPYRVRPRPYVDSRTKPFRGLLRSANTSVAASA